MIEFVTSRLQEGTFQPSAFIFALLLGLGSAVLSACCTLPSMGIIVGFSGSRQVNNRKEVLVSVLYFMLGTVVSLMLLGAVAGFVGQVAQSVLGIYWKLFAGFASIVMGIATLKLLPVNFSNNRFLNLKTLNGKFGLALSGFILGGIIAINSLCCNPGIFIIISASILQGKVIWAMLLMSAFAIGFSIPLGAVFFGISMSIFRLAAKGVDSIFRWVAGSLLLIIGFYFLITF